MERTRLQAIISLRNLGPSNGQDSLLSLPDTLAGLGPLRSDQEDNDVTVNDLVTFSLTNLANGILELDPASGMLHFVDPGQAGEGHQVYLHTDTSLRRWLERLAGYNLAGVVLEHSLDESFGNQKWELVRAYANMAVPTADNDPVWLWTIAAARNPEAIVKEDVRPLVETSYTWQAPEPGQYRVDVSLSDSTGIVAIPVANLTQGVVAGLTPTSAGTNDNLPTATPTPASTRTPTRTATPIPGPTATATVTPPPQKPSN